MTALSGKHFTGTVFFVLGVVLFGLVMFHCMLGGDGWLFSTDDGPGVLALEKQQLSGGFACAWDTMVYAGKPIFLKLSFNRWLLSVLPLKVFINWVHLIDLVLTTLFFGLFLRLKKMSWPAAVLGSLTACWVGSTFTLVHAGHLGKFGVVLFAALSLWLIELAIQRRNWAYSALAGGAMGGMFLEQQDMALFFLIMIAPYVLFAYLRAANKEYGWLVRQWVVMGIVFFLVSLRPIWGGYEQVIEGHSFSGVKTPEEQWDHATQWSWPPNETIEFMVPGYLGWRSGDPYEPYRGRLGRTSGWDTQRRGVMNFKLESEYIGYLPLAFAFLATAMWFMKRGGDGGDRADRMFWMVTTVVLLCLSFGKFFPLYRLLYNLPLVGSIRNPVKFLQVFQFSLGVLAAYGVDDLINLAGAKQEGGE